MPSNSPVKMPIASSLVCSNATLPPTKTFRLATKEDQHKATKNVTPKDADPYKAKAKAKARALSSDALAEALAKGKRREAEMVAAQAARQEEADAAWRNWARRQDLSPVGAPPSK